MAGDTGRYLRGADQLLSAEPVSGKARSYLGYVGLVAAVRALPLSAGSELWALAILQAVALVAASLCLYHLGAMLFSPDAGLIAAALYSVNVYALRWAPFILTEALFIALVIVSAWLCVVAARRPRVLAAAVPVVVFTALVRPNGLAMLPVFGIYLLAQLRGRIRVAAFGLALVALLAMAPAIHGKLDAAAGHEDLVANLEQGTVMWHVSRIDMPRLGERTGDQVLDFARYASSYPLATFRLAGARLRAAYWFPRADYSMKHRIALTVTLPILYVVALAGVAAACCRGGRRDFLLPLGLIAAQSAVIAASFANHDHRFVTPVVALILLFVANGVTAGRERFLPGLRKQAGDG